MRKFSEPTLKNFLREPLVLGLPIPGLLFIIFSVCLIMVLGTNGVVSNSFAIFYFLATYLGLRLLNKFSKIGWEESIIYRLERLLNKKVARAFSLRDSQITIINPDTSDPSQLIQNKLELEEKIRSLNVKTSIHLVFSMDYSGIKATELSFPENLKYGYSGNIETATDGLATNNSYVYSLYALPTTTDPFFIFSLLKKIDSEINILMRIDGADQNQIKKIIEVARRRAAPNKETISDIDCEVSFEESSSILEGISRGDEYIAIFSFVVISNKPIDLNPDYFLLEKTKELPVYSALGLRRRNHRKHIMRSANISDLIPTVFDPKENGKAILVSRRGKAVYFSPLDERLEALHWLVVGATGSGKSFFTGLVLRRLIQANTPISILFLDHNRSFKRFIIRDNELYFEPQNIDELNVNLQQILNRINQKGTIQGIELSDLCFSEKKHATKNILESIEFFLRNRNTDHVVYIVIDECWNFLRDEPILIQRAFREYRKLNGAVIAITQSLSDFLSSEGKNIFQNAPVRILLRQGEDLEPYSRLLGLNEVELGSMQTLAQRKKEFSECLIKTPFLSRIGRLRPTAAEYELLRTDNLREEFIKERKAINA